MLLHLALLSTASTLTPAQAEVVGVFVDACARGQVNFAPGTAKPVEFASLPESLRWWFRARAAQPAPVYEFQKQGFIGYLIQLEKPHKDSKKMCVVASPGLPVAASYMTAFPAVAGQQYSPEQATPIAERNHLILSLPERGLFFEVLGLERRYTILLVDWFTERAARVREAVMNRQRQKLQKKSD